MAKGEVTVKLEMTDELRDALEEIKRGARNSRSDQERLQQIHDYAAENGANCEKKSLDVSADMPAFHGGEVKALDDNGRIGGYLVRFSTENDPDLTGDYFTKDTDFGEAEKLPVLYNHGFDKHFGKRKIGVAKVSKDDVGVWAESQLALADEYEKMVFELAKAGKLGYSSGAAAHTVDREQSAKAYWIKQWYMAEASLTPTPAEPRNSVTPIKSLITPEAAWPDKSEKQETQTNKENAMDENAIKAMFDKQKDEISTLVEEKAEAAATKAVDNVLEKLPEVKAKLGATVEVVVDEADRPFKSIAENALAVKTLTLQPVTAEQKFPRLKFLKATGASEGVPFDGGVLLDPTLTSEIIKPMHEMGPFSNDVRRLPVGANSNYGWINAVDETSRATGSRWGGIRGYRIAEAVTKTASKPTFRRINWELKEYAAVVVATDVLLADAPLFSEIVRTGVSEELNFMLNDDIMNGAGVAGPQGFMNSGALITVTRTTGSKILGEDISAMWNRMDLRGRKTANWYIGNDSQPQLDNLFAVGSTAVLYPYASIGQDGIQRLYGRPVKVTEFNASLNTTGDIALFDPAQYLLWEKGGVEAQTSIHVYFLTDETAFRFVTRVDGSLSVNTPLTPYKGSTTTSPVVVLGSAT
jgi:HK97 family phage major capsid protein/HK97 family phage prohead protease